MSKTISKDVFLSCPFVDTDTAADYLMMSAKTLKNHRAHGTGPKFRKHGGRVVYHKQDLVSWSEQRSYPKNV